MNIDELKNKAENVEIPEVIPDPRLTEIKDESLDIESQPKEFSEEDKEKTEKFLRSALIKRHGWILKALIDRMKNKHLSIEQIKEEIIQKRSPFSAHQREFIYNFKTEFLVDLLKDMLNQKDLHEINLT